MDNNVETLDEAGRKRLKPMMLKLLQEVMVDAMKELVKDKDFLNLIDIDLPVDRLAKMIKDFLDNKNKKNFFYDQIIDYVG
jgi:hypothetical protein